MRSKLMSAIALAVGVVACSSGGNNGGTGNDAGSAPPANTITISNFTFTPANLTVAPGAVVTVVNRDGMAHSVTSQSAPGQFVAGAVNGVSFDTGPFTASKVFTIPAAAPTGTVVPYFCKVHLSGMANAGQITISADAGTDGG